MRSVVLGVVLGVFSGSMVLVPALALELGESEKELEPSCTLSYVGKRDGLTVYSCGWTQTPFGRRFSGVGLDESGVAQKVLLVNENSQQTLQARQWLESYYGEPTRRSKYLTYWSLDGTWIALVERSDQATAVELSTQDPRIFMSSGGSSGPGFILPNLPSPSELDALNDRPSADEDD